MNKKKEIQIDEQVINFLEGLNYEINVRQFIITHMISNNMNRQTEMFKKYHDEYLNFIVEYDVAKRNFIDNISNQYDIHNIINWSLDFLTKKLTIIIGGEKNE